MVAVALEKLSDADADNCLTLKACPPTVPVYVTVLEILSFAGIVNVNDTTYSAVAPGSLGRV